MGWLPGQGVAKDGVGSAAAQTDGADDSIRVRDHGCARIHMFLRFSIGEVTFCFVEEVAQRLSDKRAIRLDRGVLVGLEMKVYVRKLIDSRNKRRIRFNRLKERLACFCKVVLRRANKAKVIRYVPVVGT